MNEVESDWISLSQSQSGVSLFLSESERRKQGVWIQDGSIWIQHGRIQNGCHHQVEWEWMSEVFLVQIVGTNLGKCEWVWEEKLRWLNPRWWNSSWQNSRWLASSCWVRMNEWSFFVKKKWLNPRWQNSIWLPSSSWMRINDLESNWIFWSQSFEQNGQFQDGRIEYGCHHQVEWEWMTWVKLN